MNKAKAEAPFMPGQYVKPPVPRIYKPPRPLTVREKATVAANRNAVLMHLPEMEPFIKELYEAGMIDGWRSVGEVVLLNVDHIDTLDKCVDKTEGNKHGND